MSDDRPNAEELEPFLRDRLFALDEPVSRKDWQDVAGRARRLRRRRRIVLPAAAGAAVVAALVIGGLQLEHSRTHQAAPTAAVHVADEVSLISGELRLGSPVGLAPIGAAIGTIQSAIEFEAGGHPLFVSPTDAGGFCYEWAGEANGCQLHPPSIGLAWGADRVVGTVWPAKAATIRISFTDGTSVTPTVFLVPPPVNAGFFVVKLPAGKIVLSVTVKRHGKPAARLPWYAV